MCQIDVCTCTRLFETMPGVQPPPRSPATLPPANQPPPSRPAALVLFHEELPPSLPCHTNPYRYLYVLPPTTHIALVSLTVPAIPRSSPPSLLRAHHTTHSFSPVFLSRRTCPFPSFPFCFHFRLPQTPVPIQPGGYDRTRGAQVREHRRGLSKRMR